MQAAFGSGSSCAHVPRLNLIRTTTTDHPLFIYRASLTAIYSIQMHRGGPASTVPPRTCLPIPDNISLSAHPPPLYQIKYIALARSMHAPLVNGIYIVSIASLLLGCHAYQWRSRPMSSCPCHCIASSCWRLVIAAPAPLRAKRIVSSDRRGRRLPL